MSARVDEAPRRSLTQVRDQVSRSGSLTWRSASGRPAFMRAGLIVLLLAIQAAGSAVTG